MFWATASHQLSKAITNVRMKTMLITFLGGSISGQPVTGVVGVDTAAVVYTPVDGTTVVGDGEGGVPAVVTDGVDGWEGVVEGHGPWNTSISQLLLQTA